MNILSICGSPEVLKVMMYIQLLVKGICIVVPIIMIVVLTIEYMKAVSSGNDDAAMKVTRSIIYRAIAIVLIFFMPTLVKMVTYLADSNADGIYGCIENATPENIMKAYTNVASNRLNTLKETLSVDDYNFAKMAISEIDDVDIKNTLLEELDTLKEYVDIKSDINDLINSYNRSDYVALYEKIEKIEDEEIRNTLLTLAEEIKGQKPLDVQSGTFQKKYTGSKDYLDYWEYIPSNPTTNMPIVIFLHGDGEVSNMSAVKNIGFIRGTKNVYGDDFPYIVIQPNRRSQRWQVDSVMTTVKELIDYTCEQYLCDTDHIIITGMSGGAVGVWSLVSKYGDYFSCAVPVSCPGYVNTDSYKNVPVRAFVGGASDDYNTYYWSMYNNVKTINNVWGNATLEVISGGTHSSTYHTVYSTPEVIEWMLEQ